MTKFHINPKSGEPGRCSAKANNCPYGTAEEHFDSSKEARIAYEKKNSEVLISHNRRLAKNPLAKKANQWNAAIAVSANFIQYTDGLRAKFVCGECGHENNGSLLKSPPRVMYFEDESSGDEISVATCARCKKDNVFSDGNSFVLNY